MCKPLWPPRLWRRSGRFWRPRPRLHTHWSDSSQGVERAWVRVAREAVGPADGQVVPQQWLAHTTAPTVRSDDRRRLDLVVYGATPLFFVSHAFLRPRGTRGPCATKPTHYQAARGQGGASAPPRGARAALARARHQGRRREATRAGRQRKRAARRLRGAPTTALPRQ